MREISLADYNVFQTGAGISTSAGIPDFRSPDTGLYANLERLNLPYPEAVFDISYFRKNPRPFYALAREMYPGRFRPTLAHLFIKLLYDKGRLLKLFTQNIDCLERSAGLPAELIVEAHGSFAEQSCIDCKAAYPSDLMHKAIEANDVPLCQECMGLVKPNIVFFGEALPQDFMLNRTLPAAADLCIIMGTSLTVQPFASLPMMCRRETPRVLINLEQAGGLGSRPDDVVLLGECDAGVLKLAEALGWKEDLLALREQIAPASEVTTKPEEAVAQSRDELLHDEIERLTEEVDHTLRISRDYNLAVLDKLREPKDEKEGGEKDSIEKQRSENEEGEGPKLEIPSSGEESKLSVLDKDMDKQKQETAAEKETAPGPRDEGTTKKGQGKPPSTL